MWLRQVIRSFVMWQVALIGIKKIGGFLGSVLSCKATLSHYTLLFRLEFAFHTFVSKPVLSTSLITFGHCQLVYTNKNTFKSINTINNSKRKNGE
jgi:hypothetical protein